MSRRLRGWRLLLFAKCKHASHADSDEWDGPIERDRWWAARLHRLACGPCQEEHRDLVRLRQLLESAPDRVRHREANGEARLSDEAATRIATALAAEVGDDAGER